MEDPVQQHQGWKPHHNLTASDISYSPIQRRIVSARHFSENDSLVPFIGPADQPPS